MQNKVRTRIGSILLCMAMLLSLLPVSALAAEETPAMLAAVTQVGTLDELKSAVEVGGEIQLTAAIEVNSTLTISKGVTIDGAKADGGRYAITYTGGAGTNLFNIETEDPVTIRNLDGEVTTGRLMALNTTSPHVTLENGTFYVKERGISFVQDGVATDAEVTLDNTQIRCTFAVNDDNYGENTAIGDYRGISIFDVQNSTITLTNGSELSGFGYCINVAGTRDDTTRIVDSTGLNVIVQDSLLRGWTGFNISASYATFEIINSTVLGINNSTGESNSFASIVFYGDLKDSSGSLHVCDNELYIRNSKITNYQNGTITTPSGKIVLEELLRNDGGLAKLTFAGNVTFEDTTGKLDTALDLDLMDENEIPEFMQSIIYDEDSTVTCTSPDSSMTLAPALVAQVGGNSYLSLTDALAAATDGQTVTLLTDVTDGSGIIVPSGSNLTIDFGGHTYTVIGNLAGSTGTETQCFQLLRDSTVTMKNGTIIANNSNIKMIIQNYANLTLDGMTLDATKGSNTVSYVMSNNHGNVTITGNTCITAKDGMVAFDVYYWPSNGYVDGITVTVDDHMTGTITGDIEYASDGTETDVAEKSKLNIEAGTFIGNIVTKEASHGISITGGAFSSDPTDYLADSYETVRRGDQWVVGTLEELAVAEVGGVQHTMLEAAIAAANSGETVELLADATVLENIVITDKNITIDTNGYHVIYSADASHRQAVIDLNGTSEVVITGNGYFDLDSNYFSNNTIGYTFRIEGQSKLTIENGTYYTGLTCVQAGDKATAYIKGGSFSASTDWNGVYWLLNLIDNSNAQIIVSGGTFENYDPSNSATESPAINFCAEGYVTASDENGGKTYYTVVPAAAQVDGTYYATLAEAIEAAQNGENKTVTLLRDISAESWTQIWNIQGITLDGNGHTIKVNAIESLQNHDALFHSAGNNTFRNLTIDLSGVTADSLAQGSRAFSAAPGDTFTKVTIKGNEHISYGITVGGTDADNETVTVDGCTFEDIGYAVYDSESASVENLEIKDSTMTGCEYAVILRSKNGQFIGNTVNGGKLNIMTDQQTVTGNTFEGESRIKFYDKPAVFEKNNISADSYLAADEGVTGIDVSENYWGGGAPSEEQLGGVNVTGSDVYYEDPSMDEDDLNTYVPPSTGGGSSSSGDYLISVKKTTHGKVTVNPGRADKGDTVTISVKPDTGYELDELTVTDEDGDTVKLTNKGDGKYTFTMPGSKVTVEAVFVKDGTAPVEPTEPATSFQDVSKSAWYYDAVEYAVEHGFMAGMTQHIFAPDAQLTRAQLAQMLYALEGSPKVTESANFTDVAEGTWYANAVNWAAENKLVSGYGDGAFGPDDALTREQLTAILYAYAKGKGAEMDGKADLSKYTDIADLSAWAETSMAWAVDAGLVGGMEDGTLAPAGTATRAQMAQIMRNLLEKVL